MQKLLTKKAATGGVLEKKLFLKITVLKVAR